jgi:hypothetical protein
MAEGTARTAASGIPNGTLCAGGTLTLRPLTLARGLWLLIEMALIYLGVPFLVERAVHGYHVPVFIALLPVLAIILVLLLIDPTFSLRRELSCGFSLLTFVSILAVFAIGGGAVAYWVAQHHPDWFLEFPRNRPDTYWTIMLLYPLMSVPPQELVYRTFFFHRNGVLFARAWWLAIPVNAALFGFGHIVIGTELAVMGTMASGLLFALRYAVTRSFRAVYLEHTLWGGLVFTVPRPLLLHRRRHRRLALTSPAGRSSPRGACLQW